MLIVQNNSFPFDRRVWKEASSLRNAGYRIHVISPASRINPLRKETVEDIEVFRFENEASDGTKFGFAKEYARTLFCIYWITLRLLVRERYDVIHVANPPDLFWPLAILGKLFGTKFVFDQHDLAPEMYRTKFGSGFLHSCMAWNEKLSIRIADAVIFANEAFKQRCFEKYGIKEKLNAIVMNGPLDSFAPKSDPTLKEKFRGKKVILYVGLMTVNDNIEVIVEVARRLIGDFERKDCVFVLLGGGDVEQEMRALANSFHLEDSVLFLGMVDQEKVMRYLGVADLCIASDRPNGLNEYLTLVKILEYMKAGKAFVSFKLAETMRMAGNAGLYAEDVDDFVAKIQLLLGNPDMASRLGDEGARRVDQFFRWQFFEKELLRVYASLLN